MPKLHIQMGWLLLYPPTSSSCQTAKNILISTINAAFFVACLSHPEIRCRLVY
jgi:hypothetical protein